MCGLWTRPWTDVDPPRSVDPWSDADGLIGGVTICHRRTANGGRAYRLAPPAGRYLVDDRVSGGARVVGRIQDFG